MDWRLILQLSLFGLAMGVATVYVIPSRLEPFCWLGIFGFCAWVIAHRRPDRPFQHGLLVSVVNGLWITTAHVLLADRYLAGHPEEAAMMASSPLGSSPRLMMAVTGPVIGVVSGLVLGLMSWFAARMVRRPAP
jgi:hypothetical protein